MGYSTVYATALQSVAAALGANPDDLKALIQAESSWKPDAYNSSGAVGLIQFMPQTLKSFGLLSNTVAEKVPMSGKVPETVKQEVKADFLSKWPTVEAQLLGPVKTYLMAGAPYPTEQSLFLQVFYPSYRTLPPDTLFPLWVRDANPGIDTIASYIAFVKKKPKIPFLRRVLARLSGSAPSSE